MTLSERSNYFVAMAISLLLHLLLLLIYIPGFVAKSELVTYPVGIVEIAAGTDLGNGSAGVTSSMTDSVPVSEDKTPPIQNKKPPADTKDIKKTAINPVVKTKPAENSIVIPKKEGIAVTEPAGKGGTPGGSRTETEGFGTGGGGGTGKPIGFGTGEGMVTVLGPKPNYPKDVLNEEKEGEVEVKILVKADGSLEQVRLIKLSGDFRLDKAAISSIERTWKFKATSKDYYIDLVFVFSLESGVYYKFLNSESR